MDIYNPFALLFSASRETLHINAIARLIATGNDGFLSLDNAFNLYPLHDEEELSVELMQYSQSFLSDVVIEDEKMFFSR